MKKGILLESFLVLLTISGIIEAAIELRNRSKESANIIITSLNGCSKNTFSLNASGSKIESIKIGSTISFNGNVVLTVTADMNDESKIIAQ